MSEDLYSLWKDTVDKVASFVVKDFPNTSVEDLTQDLWVFILENRSLKHPDDVGSSYVLTQVAKTAAFKLRTQHLQVSVQYAYRPSDVKKILESVYHPEMWFSGISYVPADAKSINQDDQLVVNGDVASAVERLPEQYKKAILERYRFSIIPESQSAEYRKLNRAITKLTELLNSYKPKKDHEGPGARKAISNATARHILGTQGDAEYDG